MGKGNVGKRVNQIYDKTSTMDETSGTHTKTRLNERNDGEFQRKEVHMS